MGKYLELLKRIDENKYLTEREHREYLYILNELIEHVEKLEEGKILIYCGNKVIAMNRDEYYYLREKQLDSPHAMAFLQNQTKYLCDYLDINIYEENNEYYIKYIDLEGDKIVKRLTKYEYERLRGIDK